VAAQRPGPSKRCLLTFIIRETEEATPSAVSAASNKALPAIAVVCGQSSALFPGRSMPQLWGVRFGVPSWFSGPFVKTAWGVGAVAIFAYGLARMGGNPVRMRMDEHGTWRWMSKLDYSYETLNVSTVRDCSTCRCDQLASCREPQIARGKTRAMRRGCWTWRFAAMNSAQRC
jgi:hypothetical protein